MAPAPVSGFQVLGSLVLLADPRGGQQVLAAPGRCLRGGGRDRPSWGPGWVLRKLIKEHMYHLTRKWVGGAGSGQDRSVSLLVKHGNVLTAGKTGENKGE